MKLSDLESELGFQEIETLGLFDPYAEFPQRWAAKILGESDIIVRIGTPENPTYQHWRFGRFENLPKSNPGWRPIGSLFDGDASKLRQVISDASFGVNETKKLNAILPVKAEIKLFNS